MALSASLGDLDLHLRNLQAQRLRLACVAQTAASMPESNLSADTRRQQAQKISLNSDVVTDSAWTSHNRMAATGTGMLSATRSSIPSRAKTMHPDLHGDLQDSLGSAVEIYTHESVAQRAEQLAGRSVSPRDHVAEHGSGGRLGSQTTSTSRREPLQPSSRPVKMDQLQSESQLDADTNSEAAGKAGMSSTRCGVTGAVGSPSHSLQKSIPVRPSPGRWSSSVEFRSELSRAGSRGVRRRQQRRLEFGASQGKRAQGSPKRCAMSPSRIQLGRAGTAVPPQLPWSHTAHVLSAVRCSVSAAADRIVAAIRQLDSDVRSRDQTVEARAVRAAVRAVTTSTRHRTGHNRRAMLRSGGKLMPTRSRAKGNRGRLASRLDKKNCKKGKRRRAAIGRRRAPSRTSVRAQQHDQHWLPTAGPPSAAISGECTLQIPRSNTHGIEVREFGSRLSGLEARDAAQREENPRQNHALVDEPELVDVVLEAGQARQWARQAPLSPPLRAVRGRLHSSRQAASLAGASADAAAARASGECQTRRQQVAQLDALVAELRQHSADVKRQLGTVTAQANVEKIRADQAVLRAASSARARAGTKVDSSSDRKPSQRDPRLAAPRAVRLELSGLAGGSSRALRKRSGKHSRRIASGRPPQAGGDTRDLYLHGIMRPVRFRAAGRLR